MANLRVNPNYGDGHSKRYQPSEISSFLVEHDEEGNIVRYNNDVRLLLHQKDLHKKIGLDVIRSYVDSLNGNPEPKLDLSDEELLSILPPDELDTFTDAYQYRKYLDEHHQEFKTKYDALQARKKQYDEEKKRYESFFDTKGD